MPIDDFQHVFQPAADPDAPTLLLLHGTGGGERDLLPVGRALSPESALLSPRGNVSERGAARFFARLAEGVFDPDEIVRRTGQLADWLAMAVTHYRIDPAQLFAAGFSNGANIAATLLLLHPVSLAGAILFRPMVVFDRPAPAGSLRGKRVLIVSGSADPLVPPDHPPRLAALLRTGDADVALHSESAGHGLVAGDLAAAQDWLKSPPRH